MAYQVPAAFTRLAVVGNGIIGHGVAQVFAAGGTPVTLIGRNPASLDKALERMRASLAEFVAHGLLATADVAATIDRVTTSTTLDDAAGADLVIEAVTEDLPLKLDIFEHLDAICPPPAVLGSSSGQPASALVAKVKHRERVIATHFWYPPQLIPLVEVCGGPETAPEVIAWACDAIRTTGKEPVVIDREIPGFIGNRLQFALLREAWALWADGVASAEAIDAVVRNSFGRRIAVTGPIESADVGGLYTMYHFGKSLIPDLDISSEPPRVIADLVADGANGLANGRGLYDWSKRDGQALVKARMDELFRWLKHDRDSRK
jgi:3-hydroxyacyl-CoA dehydrogenase